MEEHQYFFIDIFHNLVDSNLSKVNTDSKANPEFIKPERQEMSYCKDNNTCVYGSDCHFAKSLSTFSCTRRNVEQNARICLLDTNLIYIYMFILLYANCVVMYCVSFYVVVGNKLYLILSYLVLWERGWIYSTSLMSFCVETIASSFVLMITFLPVCKPVCNRTDGETVHLC